MKYFQFKFQNYSIQINVERGIYCVPCMPLSSSVQEATKMTKNADLIGV